MSDLSPEDRTLLERARSGHEPTDGDRRRVRAALVATLGVGAGVTASTTTASAMLATSAVAKVVAALVVAGAVGASAAGVGALAFRATHDPRGVRDVRAGAQLATHVAPNTAGSAALPIGEPSGPAPGERPPARSLAASAPAASGATSPAASLAASLGASPAVSREVARPVSHDVSPVAPASADERLVTKATSLAGGASNTSPVDLETLEAETQLLSAAMAARRAGDESRALALFDEHARRFSRGVLADERDAERILVLCELGRADDARRLATEFLRARPRSPLAAKVRASCVSPSIP